MWKVYAKRGGIALSVLLLLYSFFWMNVGYQSPFRHCQDIWNSQVVQEKLDLVQQEITGLFSGSIAKAKKEKKKLAKRDTSRSIQQEQISDDDRKALDLLINKSTN